MYCPAISTGGAIRCKILEARQVWKSPESHLIWFCKSYKKKTVQVKEGKQLDKPWIKNTCSRDTVPLNVYLHWPVSAAGKGDEAGGLGQHLRDVQLRLLRLHRLGLGTRGLLNRSEYIDPRSNHVSSVADPDPPDPHDVGPPGSGSNSQRYGSRSRSFHHQAKIVRKPWFLLFCD